MVRVPVLVPVPSCVTYQNFTSYTYGTSTGTGTGTGIGTGIGTFFGTFPLGDSFVSTCA